MSRQKTQKPTSKAKFKPRGKRTNTVIPIILGSVGFVLILVFAIIMSNQSSTAIRDQDSIPRISVTDAKKALDNGEAVFVDVRVAEIFVDSHIPGAVNIPLADIEREPDILDPQDWIITYCT
jgi:hypothetical protein